MIRFLILWSLVAGSTLACGPVLFVPGVRLGGTEAPTPSSWSGVEIPEEVQLKAEGGWLPRVVNIWAVESEGDVYVSGSQDAGWTSRLLEHPETQLRVVDDVYALRAVPVNGPQERLRVRDAYLRKYREQMQQFAEEQGREAEDFGSSNLLFRLEAR